MRTYLLLAAAALAPMPTFAGSEALQSGPMNGYSHMREAAVWVQTKKAATVVLEYRDSAANSPKRRSAPVTTSAEKAFTALLLADSVEPGKTYFYDILVDGKKQNFSYTTSFSTPPLWQWRTNPPQFSIAMGSCFYINEPEYDRPGNPYGGGEDIVRSIYEKKPTLMLWLGDNTYLREADWNSRTGVLRRYTHTRSLPELQPLLAQSQHIAIWDDHDFGPNDADGSFWNKETTKEAFTLFWANPSYGIRKQGITGYFEWGDAAFFLLDNRWWRSPNNRSTGRREILGAEQTEWLIDNLKESKATFKIVAVGGQFLNPLEVYENHANYREERAYILKRLEEEQITGVVFVSGDRHISEISRLDRTGLWPVFDITASPLTSRAVAQSTETHPLRVEGSFIKERNFTTLEFSGPWENRVMTVRFFNTSGKELFSYEIKASDLGIQRKK